MALGGICLFSLDLAQEVSNRIDSDDVLQGQISEKVSADTDFDSPIKLRVFVQSGLNIMPSGNGISFNVAVNDSLNGQDSEGSNEVTSINVNGEVVNGPELDTHAQKEVQEEFSIADQLVVRVSIQRGLLLRQRPAPMPVHGP